jgi:hypothetical protein
MQAGVTSMRLMSIFLKEVSSRNPRARDAGAEKSDRHREATLEAGRKSLREKQQRERVATPEKFDVLQLRRSN